MYEQRLFKLDPGPIFRIRSISYDDKYSFVVLTYATDGFGGTPKDNYDIIIYLLRASADGHVKRRFMPINGKTIFAGSFIRALASASSQCLRVLRCDALETMAKGFIKADKRP